MQSISLLKKRERSQQEWTFFILQIVMFVIYSICTYSQYCNPNKHLSIIANCTA